MAHPISRGMYYFVKRVPKRYASVDPRSRIQLSLITDNILERISWSFKTMFWA